MEAFAVESVLTANEVTKAVTDVVPVLANKISSQEVILALVVLAISAILFVVSLRFTYKILLKRDEVISELADSISLLKDVITKVVEVQRLDHQTTVHNRDLLQDLGQSLSRQESCTKVIHQEVVNIHSDLHTHALDCAKKLSGG